MDGWNTTFLLGRPIFRGELLELLVSGRVFLKNDTFFVNLLALLQRQRATTPKEWMAFVLISWDI